MAITNTVTPYQLHAAFNNVNYVCTSDRYDIATNSETVTAVANAGGFAKYTIGTHNYLVDDVITGSAFDPVVTYNVVQTVTAIDATTVTTNVAYSANDTGTLTRTNDNFKIICDVKESGNIIASIESGADSSGNFNFEISGILANEIESNGGHDVVAYDGADGITSPASQNSTLNYTLTFTEWYDDEDSVLSSQDTINVTTISSESIYAYNIALQENTFNDDVFLDYVAALPVAIMDEDMSSSTSWAFGGIASIGAGVLSITADGSNSNFAAYLAISPVGVINATDWLVYTVVSNTLVGTGALNGGTGNPAMSNIMSVNPTALPTTVGTHVVEFTVNSVGTRSATSFALTDLYTSGVITIDNAFIYTSSKKKFLTKGILKKKDGEEVFVSFLTEDTTAIFNFVQYDSSGTPTEASDVAVTINNNRGICVINDTTLPNTMERVDIRIMNSVGVAITEILSIYRDAICVNNEIRIEFENRLGGMDSYSFRDAEESIRTRPKDVRISDVYNTISISPTKAVSLIGKPETATVLEWIEELYTSRVIYLSNNTTRLRVANSKTSSKTQTRDLVKPKISIKLSDPNLN